MKFQSGTPLGQFPKMPQWCLALENKRCDAHTLTDNKNREHEPKGPNASTATQLEYKSLDKQIKNPNP